MSGIKQGLRKWWFLVTLPNRSRSGDKNETGLGLPQTSGYRLSVRPDSDR